MSIGMESLFGQAMHTSSINPKMNLTMPQKVARVPIANGQNWVVNNGQPKVARRCLGTWSSRVA